MLQEELAQVDGDEQAEEEQEGALQRGDAPQSFPEPLEGHAAKERERSAGSVPAGWGDLQVPRARGSPDGAPWRGGGELRQPTQRSESGQVLAMCSSCA